MLESGAEVNSRDKDLNTPLHAVIIINIFYFITLLKSHYTLNYYQAAAGGQVFIVQQLLEVNADCDVTNCFGNTPLHTSCLNGHELGDWIFF